MWLILTCKLIFNSASSFRSGSSSSSSWSTPIPLWNNSSSELTISPTCTSEDHVSSYGENERERVEW